MKNHERTIAADNAGALGDEILPGETLAQAWRRNFNTRRSESERRPLEARPRHLALLGRALWILMHGEEEATPGQWSPRPPTAKGRDPRAARSSAAILLAGLARSLSENEDPVMKDWLGSWSDSPEKLVVASSDEWDRLLDKITKPKVHHSPTPGEIFP